MSQNNIVFRLKFKRLSLGMELEGLREEKLATTTAINVKRSLPQGSDAQS